MGGVTLLVGTTKGAFIFNSDGQDSAGIYVGAKSGTVYFSRDEGDHWETLAENLPPILSVSTS